MFIIGFALCDKMEDSYDRSHEGKPILDTGRPAVRHIKSRSKTMHALKTVGNGVKGILGIQGETAEGEKVKKT